MEPTKPRAAAEPSKILIGGFGDKPASASTASKGLLHEDSAKKKGQKSPPTSEKQKSQQSIAVGTSSQEDMEDHYQRNNPANFHLFLPYACKELRVDIPVHVVRLTYEEYLGARKKKTSKPAKKGVSVRPLDRVKSSIMHFNENFEEEVITVWAYFNSRNRLMQIEIKECDVVTQRFLKVVTLTMPFQPLLTRLKISQCRIQDYVLNELSNMMRLSNITDLCLDDTYSKEANYHVVLDGKNRLHRLSLNRCYLNDAAVEPLVTQLETTGDVLKTYLYVLELSCNLITDIGAFMIAKMLKRNRKLLHLNLAGNLITDIGAAAILEKLAEFPLNDTDIADMRERKVKYYRWKMDIFHKAHVDQLRRRNKLEHAATGSASSRRKLGTGGAGAKAKLPTTQTKKLASPKEVASILANQMTGGGVFRDVYDNSNTIKKGSKTYCKGNLRLCSLNLAYNNLEFRSLDMILKVVRYQSEKERSENFTGLLRILIEGNNLPDCKSTFDEIDNILHKAIYQRSRLRRESTRSNLARTVSPRHASDQNIVHGKHAGSQTGSQSPGLSAGK